MPRIGTSSSVDLWPSLNDVQRLRLLFELTGKRRQVLMRFDNVITVGAGYRTIGAAAQARSRRSGATQEQLADRNVTHEVCLRFIVTRKSAKPRDPIPNPYITTVTWRGRRRRCLIPTDVDILGKGQLTQGGDWYPDGVVAKLVPGVNVTVVPEPTPGAICCRVIDKDNPMDDFLLGCHHVFTASAKSAGCTPVLGTAVYRGQTWDFLGPTVRWTNLRPGSKQVGVDAALAKSVFDDKLPPWVVSEAPKQIGRAMWPPRDIRIRAPRGSLMGRFLGLHPKLLLRYPCGDILIGPVYEFLAATAPGDSGSPVLAGDTIWGMHFYGTDHGTALAIPAFLLFGPKCFRGMTLDLPAS